MNVEENSEILNLIIIIHKINEYLLADSINLADIQAFEDLIVDFFSVRQSCSQQFDVFCNLTPKYNFLCHYSQQMEMFGPLSNVWTARCESKHREYINSSEASKNFINLPKTLANKNQKRFASRHDLS